MIDDLTNLVDEVKNQITGYLAISGSTILDPTMLLLIQIEQKFENSLHSEISHVVENTYL